jgi:esterase/lipase superfamily enzyme
VQECVSLEELYDSFLYEDVLQRIRVDCQDVRIEPILVGASLGAAAAVMTLFRHPDSFRAAIGLSGVYDGSSDRCAVTPRGNSPITYVATLASAQLAQLKRRPITLGSGEGPYENPNDSKRLADALGAKGMACRFSLWGPQRDHTWSTWRDQLPRLLVEQL